MVDVYSAEGKAQARETVASTRVEISNMAMRLENYPTADEQMDKAFLRGQLVWLKQMLVIRERWVELLGMRQRRQND